MFVQFNRIVQSETRGSIELMPRETETEKREERENAFMMVIWSKRPKCHRILRWKCTVAHAHSHLAHFAFKCKPQTHNSTMSIQPANFSYLFITWINIVIVDHVQRSFISFITLRFDGACFYWKTHLHAYLDG